MTTTSTALLFMRTLLLLLFLPSLSSSSPLRFASPLQALTLWDHPTNSTPRSLFLSRLEAGLAADAAVRARFADEDKAWAARQDRDDPRWAQRAAKRDRARRRSEERQAEAAFDRAVAEAGKEQQQQEERRRAGQRKNRNRYQFVGVIDPNQKDERDTIQWYARKKPKEAKWSLRLVHVNRDAIIKDLFNQGKVDVVAKYRNMGYAKDEEGNNLDIRVHGNYAVKERSWRTLWNFSPKHFFTDSSGMYWRERRLRPGVYTDGSQVFETKYRYKDGRNGLHHVDSLEKFLNNTDIDAKTKANIQKALSKKFPDVVMEG